MNVSFYDSIYKTKDGKIISIDQVLDQIKFGQWQIDVGLIRTAKDKPTKDAAKLKLPCITPCGVFDERKNAGLSKASGLISIDIDKIDPNEMDDIRSQLYADEYTFAGFVSASGNGLCLLVKIDPKKFDDAFEGLQQYYFNKYQVIIDPACKDLSRARFISYDPDLQHNPSSLKFKEYIIKPKKQPKVTGYLHIQNNFEKLLFSITTDIANTYQDWFKIGMAFANTYGSDGLKYFEHISQYWSGNKKNSDKNIKHQYDNCLKNKDKSIGIGTFYYYAKLNGYESVSKEAQAIAKKAYYYKRDTLDQETAVKNLVNFLDTEMDISDIQEIVKSVYESNNFNPLLNKDSDDDADIYDEVLLYLQTSHDLKRNEITKFIENKGVEQDEPDVNSLFFECKKLFPKITYENLFRLINSRNIPEYNPIKEYIESLKYNGQSNIEKIVESLNSDTADLKWRVAMFKHWMVGMMESVYGKKCDIMMVLSGVQDSGKTEFFRQLLPQPLMRYFSESQLDEGKDDKLLMTQKLMIFDDEFAGKSKQDSKKMKLMLSSSTFSLRAPYAKKNMDYKRMAILCGTSNDEELLNDPTGNRRYVIFNIIGKNNFDLFNSVDKEQLIAEAFFLFKTGITSKINADEKEIMNQMTFDRHYESTIEFELLNKFYKPTLEKDKGMFMTATEIKDHIEKNSEQKMYHKRLGQEIKRAGFIRVFSQERKLYGYMIFTQDHNSPTANNNSFGEIPEWAK